MTILIVFVGRVGGVASAAACFCSSVTRVWYTFFVLESTFRFYFQCEGRRVLVLAVELHTCSAVQRIAVACWSCTRVDLHNSFKSGVRAARSGYVHIFVVGLFV